MRPRPGTNVTPRRRDTMTPVGDVIAEPDFDDRVDLDPDARDLFRRSGHCVVRGLATAAEIATVKPSIDAGTEARRWDRRPLEERDTYGRAFVQAGGIVGHDERTRRFVLGRRFARVAAELLDVDGVRLYHDQALYKEPGGGFTPWHQDQVYWPLDTDRTVTMWMPLVDIPREIGGMVFADGTHRLGNLSEEVIGDASQRFFDDLVRERDWTLSSHGPFAVGDATFHTGWTLHSAPANNTDTMRAVMTVIYFADGARITPSDHPARELDRLLWLGGAPAGSVADSEHNPLVWHRSFDE
ncbi:MAG: phytanoyl-CoA dioxygenase family protein [Actinobacteria bacterium]|nr:phytanoyl-CoA dioxygenase family protein [Actinomycetota bacterium]